MSGIDFSLLKSTQPGIVWPAISDFRGASLLALLFQFQQSEWMPPEELESLQFRQLELLFRHAAKNVPFYQQRFRATPLPRGKRLTPEYWRKLPILERSAVQDAGDELRSRTIPKGHGRLGTIQTSGSTGQPVKVDKTEATQFIYDAITTRDHLWHQRDLRSKVANLRPESELQPGKPVNTRGWGAVNMAFRTGQSKALSCRTSIEDQATWLIKENPTYIHSLTTNAKDLATYFISHKLSLPGLREVRCFGEVLDEETIALVRQAWDVKVTDAYSTAEVGYLALLCPEEGQYHVQSEVTCLEVLDEQGAPCDPGTIGRVIVTPLHNFATPLIRYAVGDYVELGPPCACGRGLPVIKRIMGRVRNMLTRPDGSRHWPSFPAELWTAIAPVRQFQLIQHELDKIEVRLVVARPLIESEEKGLVTMLQDRFGYPFAIKFSYQENLERSAGGKFEDFISKVSA